MLDSHCLSFFFFVSLPVLPEGILQNHDIGYAAPRQAGSVVGHASSGQFLGSLLSDHSAQLLHVAVVDVALLSQLLHLTTALVHLYSLRAVRAKTRGTILCWHFSLDSP